MRVRQGTRNGDQQALVQPCLRSLACAASFVHLQHRQAMPCFAQKKSNAFAQTSNASAQTSHALDPTVLRLCNLCADKPSPAQHLGYTCLRSQAAWAAAAKKVLLEQHDARCAYNRCQLAHFQGHSLAHLQAPTPDQRAHTCSHTQSGHTHTHITPRKHTLHTHLHGSRHHHLCLGRAVRVNLCAQKQPFTKMCTVGIVLFSI